MTVTEKTCKGKPCPPKKITVYNGRVNPRPTTPRGKRRHANRNPTESHRAKLAWMDGDAIEKRK